MQNEILRNLVFFIFFWIALFGVNQLGCLTCYLQVKRIIELTLVGRGTHQPDQFDGPSGEGIAVTTYTVTAAPEEKVIPFLVAIEDPEDGGSVFGGAIWWLRG